MARERTYQTKATATATGVSPRYGMCSPDERAMPGLLLAWRPADLVCDDRAPLETEVVVGRSSKVSWCIADRRLSRRHVAVKPLDQGRFLVKDLGSKNGTFVNALRLDGPVEVEADAVVQAGGCVFVLHPDLSALASPGQAAHEQIAGRFHAAPLVRTLRVAARTGRHLLLEGESGSGKELAAHVISEVLRELGRTGPLVVQNAACFAGQDDAVATLFGVSEKSFTGVHERKGALAEADGGTLFLDEVHNLPPRAQRSLLRFAEDGLARRLGGDAKPRKLDVRLVLGTNSVPVERACEEGRLAADLVARLHRVRILALRERRADVPAIFGHVLARVLGPEYAEVVAEHIDPTVIERLCLHDYLKGNVRELEDLAAVIRARLEEGESSALAIGKAFDATFGPSARGGRASKAATESQLSPYERHREEITEAYRQVGDNLSHLQKALSNRGIKVNRRWLAAYLDRWGLRKARRRG